MKAISADILFDGTRLHRAAAVVIDPPDIAAIAPRDRLPPGMPVRALAPGSWLVPGFIDIQVNGGGDVLFNESPTPGGIRKILAAHRRFGTTALLPTLMTDSREKMRQAFAAVAALLGSEPSLLGIHCEGPFLNSERAGAHDRGMIRPPEPADLALLSSLKSGTTLITLAPECVPPGFIRSLEQAGLKIALGHSMATYAETGAAIKEGLRGFTHLFNAMRPLAAREPGPIAAALEDPRLWFGLIVDGIHVAPPMLRLALRAAGRAVLVTDAMPPVGGARTDFLLDGERIAVRDGRCARGDGTLAGSALDMASAVRNCVRLLDLPLPEALRLASAAPADCLGLGDRVGHIAAGCRADLVALDPEKVEARAVWVAAEESFASPAPSV